MSTKRILYLSQYYPPEVGAGAVRSESIVRRLGERGWKVDVVTELPNYPIGERYEGYEEGSSYTEKVTDNITVHRIWVWITKRRDIREQLSLFISFMFSSFFYVLKMGHRYDVVYCTSPPLFAGLSAMLLSKILGTKFVFEVRDLWPDSARDSFRSEISLVYRLGLWLEKIIYRGADLVIPVTNIAANIIQEKCPETPVKVIYNGVDTALFSRVADEELEIDEVLDRNKFIIGYVGSLGLIHDLDTLIRTAKICESDPDIHFLLVGDGGRNNLLTTMLDELKPNNVTWVGLKPYRQVPHYISLFDLAVNPMKMKPIFDSVITVKFYEYLSCGVPVISSDLKSISKVTRKSKSGVTVEPHNPEAMAEAIQQLKNDPEQVKELSRNARAFIQKKFDRNKLAEKIISELNSLT